jgi:UDP-N-acetyl-D-galactosamine dehydrogenase
VTVHDPLADPAEAHHEYGLTPDPDALDRSYDAVVAAVPHREYRDMSPARIAALAGGNGLVADIKGMWRGLELSPSLVRWTL